MGRIAATALFPALAVFAGAASTALVVWGGVDAASASAVGLAVFAALMAVRNWRVSETERPLLADELLGLHESIDALRAEARSARTRMTELAEVLEEAVAAGAVAVEDGKATPFAGVAGYRATRALEARIARLEAGVDQLGDTVAAATAAIEAAATAERDYDDDEEEDVDLAEAIAAVNQSTPKNGSRAAAVAARVRAAKATSAPEPATTKPAAPEAGMIDVSDMSVAAEPAYDARAGEIVDDPSNEEDEAEISAAAEPTGPAEPTHAAAPDEDVAPPQEAAPPPAAGPASDRPKTPVKSSFEPSLADARFDLSLQPIISLADREPRYFEAVFGEGATPIAALVKASAVARRLVAAGQETPVLCGAGMSALRDEAVLRAFLDFADTWDGLPESLRLEVAQSEIDLDEARDLAILERLRAKGFRFSMGQVTDLSIDIASLARTGFRVVKLDVDLVLSREREAGGDGSVVRRLVSALDRAGLELVLQKLDRVDTVRQAREAGARLGQGDAIAPPRLAAVESSWLTESGAAQNLATQSAAATRRSSEAAPANL